MALQRIKDFDPDYRSRFDPHAIVGYRLYSGEHEIGFVDDLVVDESGRFRYLVVNPNTWILGKKVLLPIAQAWIDTDTCRVFVYGLTREQVKALPEFTDKTIVDSDYEARVRNAYHRMRIAPVLPQQG